VEAPGLSKEAHRLRLGGEKPSIRFAAISADSTGWTLRLESTAQLHQELREWDRSEFTVRLQNVSYDPLLLPLPTEHPGFQGLRLQDAGDGVDVHFTPGAEAVGFRVWTPDTNAVAVRLGFAPEDILAGRLSTFAASVVSVPSFHRIVLDPGHGGTDSGDRVSGGKESELTWKLAELLRDRLRDDLDAEVLFTRDGKENPRPEVRADAANRAQADFFLSLHIHGREGGPAAFLAKAGSRAAQAPAALDDLGFKPFGEGTVPGEAEGRVIASPCWKPRPAPWKSPREDPHQPCPCSPA
jgi:N-acetylmuramoyl-L-alanine amidase